MCRGCVNYEGPERIDGILENARKMKRAYALADMVNTRSPSANRETSGFSNVGLDRYLQVLSNLQPGVGILIEFDFKSKVYFRISKQHTNDVMLMLQLFDK